MEGDLGCTYESLSKKAGKGATRILRKEPNNGSEKFWAETRKHRDAKGRDWYRPSSCGALYLNDGADASEVDPDTGVPLMDLERNWLPPIEVTEGLCLAAVQDLNGGGIVAGECVDNFACATAEDCSVGGNDVCGPLGKVCYYDTCCGVPVCIPNLQACTAGVPGLLDALDALFGPEPAPTLGGL